MAYTVPTFNLTANIFRFSGGTYSNVGSTVCNLAMGRRIGWQEYAGDASTFYGLTPALLVPAGTDLRDTSCQVNPDVVEVPAGSGRWYCCSCVDDIGKGFANEHRVATLQKVGWYTPWTTWGFSAWPFPIP